MASLFRPATVLMVQYAHYHRDQRNIATHCVGIPLIVFGIGVLLARWQWGAGPLNAAWLLWVASTLWYASRGNAVLGGAVSLVNGLLFAAAQGFAGGSVADWLGWGVGSFAVGWVLQFIGHYFEGRKPAFVDDLVGLLVGPMFVTGEALFALGWGKTLLAEIERSAGPTRIRTA